MLENIKSIFFTKKIFSILDDGIKLKLIRYNKNLQNKIDIDIMNYKRFAKRYIVYEENKKVKEYDSYNDGLIFEGEYLNGKRNGYGKEYDGKGNLLYEGEYLNGEKNGKFKKYDEYGNILYEIDY